jgi:hypothetical protein
MELAPLPPNPTNEDLATYLIAIHACMEKQHTVTTGQLSAAEIVATKAAHEAGRAASRSHVNLLAILGTAVSCIGIVVTMLAYGAAFITRLDTIESNQKVYAAHIDEHSTRLNGIEISLRQFKCILMLDKHVLTADQIEAICSQGR